MNHRPQTLVLGRCRAFIALTTLLGFLGCDGQLSNPSLYGQVEVIVTAAGQPVSGAQLILYTGARRMGFGQTGNDGHYTFRRVPQNNYGVVLTPIPAGYDTTARGVGQKQANVIDGLDVAAGDTRQIEFGLKKL